MVVVVKTQCEFNLAESYLLLGIFYLGVNVTIFLNECSINILEVPFSYSVKVVTISVGIPFNASEILLISSF